MSYRHQGITGSNNIPLGTRRRFGGDDQNGDVGYNPAEPASGLNDYKRGRSRSRSPMRTGIYSPTVPQKYL